MLRSGLLFASARSFGYSGPEEECVKIAAAVELVQTGLLIHDDVMDRDELRRGAPTVHVQYRDLLRRENVRDASRTADSFGICTGDASFFLAFGVLGQLSDSALSVRLTALFSREFLKVTVAQMQDVYAGVSLKPVSGESIISLYAYKTGRYTCGLPLVSGAIAAGASQETIHHLWKLGTSLGIVFQIRDDLLNLQGDERQTGKPVGSDIREGKQTMIRYLLMKKASDEDRNRLSGLFGNANLTQEDVSFVRKCFHTYGIPRELDDIMGAQQQRVKEILEHLPLSPGRLQSIRDIIQYILNRNT